MLHCFFSDFLEYKIGNSTNKKKKKTSSSFNQKTNEEKSKFDQQQ